MKISPLMYFMLCALAIAVYITNLAWPGQFTGMMDLVFSLVMLGGLWVMIWDSRLKRSWFFIPVIIGALLVIAGIAFMMLHWPGPGILMLSGTGVITLFYTVYFFTKKEKEILDIMKLVWLLTRMAGVALVYLHLPFGRFAIHASDIILLITIFLFLYRSQRDIAPHDNTA